MNKKPVQTVRLWRENVHVTPRGPGRDVADIVAIAALAFLLLVITIMIFA